MPEPLDRLRLPVVPIEPHPAFAAGLLRRITGPAGTQRGQGATIRYFVHDLDEAMGFYCEELGFEVELRPSPDFAMLYRGDLRLLLSVPTSHVLLDGSVPEPGGWNRISLEVADLEAAVERLRRKGSRLRNEITSGVGVRQALVEDPSGNLVELFEPTPGYHERAPSLR
jgi:catechol 2,3-dioxygenase-like lactoylglutathione lyase family enzyme